MAKPASMEVIDQATSKGVVLGVEHMPLDQMTMDATLSGIVDTRSGRQCQIAFWYVRHYLLKQTQFNLVMP